jgi:hypothetical protein
MPQGGKCQIDRIFKFLGGLIGDDGIDSKWGFKCLMPKLEAKPLYMSSTRVINFGLPKIL